MDKKTRKINFSRQNSIVEYSFCLARSNFPLKYSEKFCHERNIYKCILYTILEKSKLN